MVWEGWHREVSPYPDHEVDPKLLRPTDEPIIWADCTKLKQATGWEPAISLEQTIEDMLSYWRQKPERALVA